MVGPVFQYRAETHDRVLGNRAFQEASAKPLLYGWNILSGNPSAHNVFFERKCIFCVGWQDHEASHDVCILT